MTASRLTKWLPKCLRPAARRATPRTALALQTLEAREVPALYTWVGPASGGLWNDTNNWSTVNALGFPNAFDGSVAVVFNGAVNSIQNVDLNLSVDRITFNGNSGTIQLTENLTLDGDAPGDQVLVTGVGAYSITGTADLVLGGVNSNPFFEVPNGSSLSVFADMTGSRGITKQGAGALVLRGSNTFTGDSVVQAGALGLNGGAGNAIPAGTKTTVGGFGVAAEIRLDAAGQIANDAVVELDTSGRLNVTGAGNEVVGEIVLDGGELAAGLGFVQTPLITVKSNSTITSAVSGSDAGGVFAPPAGTTVAVDPAATLTVTGKLAGAGGFTYTGGGTTRYENPNATGSVGANSYTGLTWVKDGTLVLKDTASDSAFKGALQIGDGNGVAGSALVQLELGNEIPNTATVTIMNDGKLDLSTHDETVANLTLLGGAAVVTTTGKLTLTGNIDLLPTAILPATITGNLGLTAGTHTITLANYLAAADLVIDGVISGAGGIALNGSGTLRIQGAGANTYTGDTVVFGGTLELAKPGVTNAAVSKKLIVFGSAPGSGVVRLAADGQMPNDIQLILSAGATFDLNGNDESIGKLSLDSGATVNTGVGKLILNDDVQFSSNGFGTAVVTGNLDLGGAERTFTVGSSPAATEVRIDAVISNGSLTKNGGGVLLLTGANTYAGDTTVVAGTLLVNGSQPGSDVVPFGGVLGGTGTVGKVTGGIATIAPGTSPGTLTTNDLTTSGVYQVELNGPAAGESDQLKVNGTVDLTGAVLNLSLGYAPAVGQTFTIIDNNQADAVEDTFANLPDGGTTVVNGVTFGIDYQGGDGNDVVLTVLSVPVVPVVPPPSDPPQPYAVGAGQAGGNVVRVFNPDGSLKVEVPAFEGNVSGGVRTATADVNGDGVADLIVGTGPGTVAEVRVFDGSTGQRLSTTLPFADFQGGVFVAAADFNNDGFADIVVTPDEGGGPRVSITSGKDGAVLANFFAIDDPNFRGGARAAAGDVNGDGTPDLVISAGFGGGPRIAVYDGKSLGGTPTKLMNDFFAFEQALRNGAYVAVGDLSGDGKADLVFGGGPGGGPRVLALDAVKLMQGDMSGATLANFFAGNPDNRGGVRVTAKNLDGDAMMDVVVGDGVGAGSRVTGYLGKTIGAGTPPAQASFDAFPGFLGGVFVG